MDATTLRDISYLGNSSTILERSHGSRSLHSNYHVPSICITYPHDMEMRCLNISYECELRDLRDKLTELLDACAAANAEKAEAQQ